MNHLSQQKRALILRCLLDGTSIRGTGRVAEVAKQTVADLFEDAALFAYRTQNRLLRDLTCKRLELDEIWSFVYAKRKTVARRPVASPEAGDVWTWIAFDPDTKLVPSWTLGDRTIDTARVFLKDLAKRVNRDVQLTSDGHEAYVQAVLEAFGPQVDYAMLVKHYKEGRYDGANKTIIAGKPDIEMVSTSGVERINLTLRMGTKRFTRKTNAYSKKFRNHALAVALMMLHYNFIRRHDTIKTAPAVAAGIVPKPWTLKMVVDLIEAEKPKPNRPKHYRKRVDVVQ